MKTDLIPQSLRLSLAGIALVLCPVAVAQATDCSSVVKEINPINRDVYPRGFWTLFDPADYFTTQSGDVAPQGGRFYGFTDVVVGNTLYFYVGSGARVGFLGPGSEPGHAHEDTMIFTLPYQSNALRGAGTPAYQGVASPADDGFNLPGGATLLDSGKVVLTIHSTTDSKGDNHRKVHIGLASSPLGPFTWTPLYRYTDESGVQSHAPYFVQVGSTETVGATDDRIRLTGLVSQLSNAACISADLTINRLNNTVTTGTIAFGCDAATRAANTHPVGATLAQRPPRIGALNGVRVTGMTPDPSGNSAYLWGFRKTARPPLVRQSLDECFGGQVQDAPPLTPCIGDEDPTKFWEVVNARPPEESWVHQGVRAIVLFNGEDISVTDVRSLVSRTRRHPPFYREGFLHPGVIRTPEGALYLLSGSKDNLACTSTATGGNNYGGAIVVTAVDR